MQSVIAKKRGDYTQKRDCKNNMVSLTLKGPGIFTVFHVGADLKLQIGM